MYPNVMNKRLHFVILLMAMFFISCACAPSSFSKKEKAVYTTFKTLQTAKQFRVTGLKIAGGLHTDGMIDDDLARIIIKTGDALQLSINTASVSLKLYKTTGKPKDMDDLRVCIRAYEQVYGQFTDLVMPYIFKKIGE